MSKKSKVFLIIGIALTAWTLLCLIGYSAIKPIFDGIQNDPIDNAAIYYIYEETDIEETYGEIDRIGRNVIKKSVKTETTAKRAYGIETEEYDIVVYVSLEKREDEWVAKSYEIIEVDEIFDKSAINDEAKQEKEYYTLEDFDFVEIGKTTIKDMPNTNGGSIRAASYGGYCDYPTRPGGYIRGKTGDGSLGKTGDGSLSYYSARQGTVLRLSKPVGDGVLDVPHGKTNKEKRIMWKKPLFRAVFLL